MASSSAPLGDTQDEQTNLQMRVAQLEEQNKRMDNEFNAQRARLKDLFLVKESELRKLTDKNDALSKELDDAKSRIVVAEYSLESTLEVRGRNAAEEIATLQKLYAESLDELGNFKSELDRLHGEMERIQAEANGLRDELNNSQHNDSHSLAPVLNQVKKTIARKLGATNASSSNDDYLEDSMRQAHEDAEVLRSLVVPLEEEIKALKEKLRTTDEELQQCHKLANIPAKPNESALVGLLTPSPSSEKPPDTNADAAAAAPATACAECSTHVGQIDQLNLALTDSQALSDQLRKDVDRLKEELDREASLRRDLEQQWQDKRESHKHEVQMLNERVTHTEREFAHLRQAYVEAKDQMQAEVKRLTADREHIDRHLESLQSDNDFLAGRFGATADELQQQRIDLPSTVDELQMCMLRSHEALIEAKVGFEFEQRKSKDYYHETQLLQQQRQTYEEESVARAKAMENRIRHLQIEREKLMMLRETLEKREVEFERQASELRVQVIELRESNEKLMQSNADLRQRSSVLLLDLANSETVQQDFVRLSQSLQVQLEKIRSANTSVRWEDEDDVDQCPSCKSEFTVTRRKLNCRHCGTIYCECCITKTVSSGGQHSKPARVCDFCHTLLDSNTAPYFSQAPPHSPT